VAHHHHPVFPAGTLLGGKYRLQEVIGSGGMGHVYRAEHVAVHRQVAIKTLLGGGDDHRVALERFQQEARMAGALGHDNICEVLDFGAEVIAGDQVYYTVMPLLQGTSLGHWLKTPEATVAAIVDVFAQTLLGLQAAHDHQIVHRDLKPDNIFITTVGDRRHFVKLLDFGVSKYLDAENALSLTRTGTVMGTPLYMAPEQARGETNIDHRIDIYALGAVLYEALLGRRPYEGASNSEVMINICTQDFARPTSVDPRFSPALEAVILKAMARRPHERYDNAHAMRDALLQALQGGEARDRTTAAPSALPHQRPLHFSTTQNASVPSTAHAAAHSSGDATWVPWLIGAFCWVVAGFFVVQYRVMDNDITVHLSAGTAVLPLSASPPETPPPGASEASAADAPAAAPESALPPKTSASPKAEQGDRPAAPPAKRPHRVISRERPYSPPDAAPPAAKDAKPRRAIERDPNAVF